MNINSEALKNKQRIYIGGNHGANSIFEIIRHVLTDIQKPADFLTYNEENTLTDAPIVIIRGAEQLVDGKAAFHQFEPHILLIHKIEEDVPVGYGSFDHYISEIETLADHLPKAGSFFFYEQDAVGILMGKKEREDIQESPYGELEHSVTEQGFEFKSEGEKIVVKGKKSNFPKHAAGAKALLKRIGVSDSQFFNALKNI